MEVYSFIFECHVWSWNQGLYSLRRRRLISIGIPIINLRRSSDRLSITGINPEAILIMGDHYGHLLCPGLQPGPPSQAPGGLGQR